MITDPYIGMPITLGGSCPGNWVPPNRPPMPPAGNGNSSGNGTGAGGSGTQQPSRPETPDASNTPNTPPDTRAFDARYLGSLPLAMAYVPMQQWKTTYTLSGGLSRGTIFPELDLPFEGRTILSERAKGGR